jgi:hypothetical protein
MTTTIDRSDLVTRLLGMPARLTEAEGEAMAAQRTVSACREGLADQEATLLTAGAVPGSNAEARAAHLRLRLTAHREALQQAQEEAQDAAVRLRVLQEEAKSLRCVARLLGGDSD